jgi:hypothetical protein
MISPDAKAVSVPTRDDDVQIVIRHLDASRYGQGTAMQRVHAISIDKAWQV